MARPNGSRNVRGWTATPRDMQKAGVTLAQVQEGLSEAQSKAVVAAIKERKMGADYLIKGVKGDDGYASYSISDDGKTFRYASKGSSWSTNIPITQKQAEELVSGKKKTHQVAKESQDEMIAKVYAPSRPEPWMARKPAFDTNPFKGGMYTSKGFELTLDRLVRSKGDTLKIGRSEYKVQRVNKPSKNNRFGTLTLIDSTGNKSIRKIEYLSDKLRSTIYGEQKQKGLTEYELISRLQ